MKTVPEIIISKRIIRYEKSRCGIHPWIFAGSIAEKTDNPEPGSVVKILDSKHNFVGYGYFNPISKIAVRLLSTNEDEFPDENYVSSKIIASIERRKNLPINSNAIRLVFGESDLLPGLIVDRYDDIISIQTLTAGMEKYKDGITAILKDQLSPRAIIERNDCEIRKLEGLPIQKAILYGNDEEIRELKIMENGLNFFLNPLHGQKTGFYMDQRDNRLKVKSFVRNEMEILDCFCFSGAFSVYCSSAAENISLTLLDESQEALNIAVRNLENNKVNPKKTEFLCGNAFKILRQFRDSRRSFDMIILDPPKFAPTISDAQKATRGYKDINLLAMKLLRKGGFLATFSCSSGVKRELFFSILQSAAKESGRDVQIISEFYQPPDHPILLSFPESAYLKGFICKVF